MLSDTVSFQAVFTTPQRLALNTCFPYHHHHHHQHDSFIILS